MFKFLHNFGDEYSTMILKSIRWIVFGVLSSAFPFIVVVACYWLMNDEMLELEYLLDLLLITFAVAANAINLMIDDEKQIRKEIRVFLGVLSGISMLFCLGTYLVFFQNCFLNAKLLEQFTSIEGSLEDISLNKEVIQELEFTKQMIKELNPSTDKLSIYIKISLWILSGNFLIGLIAEVVDSRCQNNRGKKMNVGITNVKNFFRNQHK